MTKLCNNPVCDRHVEMAQGQDRKAYVNVLDGDQTYIVNRFRYRSRGGHEMWLCDVCHSAVETINKETELTTKTL